MQNPLESIFIKKKEEPKKTESEGLIFEQKKSSVVPAVFIIEAEDGKHHKWSIDIHGKNSEEIKTRTQKAKDFVKETWPTAKSITLQ